MVARRKWVVGLVAVGVVVACVWLVVPREREPGYGGKRLSEWVDNFPVPSVAPSDEVEQDKYLRKEHEFDEAIRHMGTNAVPLLARWIRYEPPEWKVNLQLRIMKFAGPKLAGHLMAAWPLYASINDKEGMRRFISERAFRALGSEGRVAIPSLAMVIGDPDSLYSAMAALSAITNVSNGGFPVEALPALVSGLANRHPAVRSVVHGELTHLGSNAWPALPLFVGLLHHEEPDVRRLACQELGGMGTNARFAITAVVALLKDPDPVVRAFATNAFLQIDPQAWFKAMGDPHP